MDGTKGARFSESLDDHHINLVMPKGCNEEIDSYSGFYDNGKRNSTGLAEELRSEGINTLWVLGLATDYCVKATVLDALEEGFAVRVIEDGIRAVDLETGDGDRAIQAMREAGANIVQSSEVEDRFPLAENND